MAVSMNWDSFFVGVLIIRALLCEVVLRIRALLFEDLRSIVD